MDSTIDRRGFVKGLAGGGHLLGNHHLERLGLFTDPTRVVVEAAEPSNVDTVMIDGRILKRSGKFTTLVPEQIVADAVLTRDTVRKRLS